MISERSEDTLRIGVPELERLLLGNLARVVNVHVIKGGAKQLLPAVQS